MNSGLNIACGAALVRQAGKIVKSLSDLKEENKNGKS
jgi:hypothetical protein